MPPRLLIGSDTGGTFTGSRKLTRTGLAIDSIVASRNPDKATRILLFTDGYSTESLAGIADRLVKENIPLDLRLLPEPPGSDFRVRRLRLPVRAQSGEPFLIEAEVTGQYRVGDVRHCFADISAAREHLGFEPRVDLDQGLRELGAWLGDQVAIDRVDAARDELLARGLAV